jgi:hypothetical protein
MRKNQNWKHNHENDLHQKKKKMIKSKSTQATTKKWMVMSGNMIRKTTWSQEWGDQEWEYTMGRQSWMRT